MDWVRDREANQEVQRPLLWPLFLGAFWGLWYAPVVDFLGSAYPHGARSIVSSYSTFASHRRRRTGVSKTRIRRGGDPDRMLFVGLDLHKKYSEFAIMDVGGNLLRQGRLENTLKYSEGVRIELIERYE